MQINQLETRRVLEYYGITPTKESSGKSFYQCPLPEHKEQHGNSFVVFEDNGWHCFGKCGRSGNAVTFIMAYKGIPFALAVKEAEKIFGVKLEYDKTKEKYQPLYNANAELASIYQKALATKPNIIQYLKERGMTEESIQYWCVGWAEADHVLDAPDKYELYAQAGLMLKKDKYIPVFNRRIVFPIRDISGDIIGFTGRVDPFASSEYKEKTGKYINTATTEIFEKKKAVFGYGSRFNELVKEHKFIGLVEGAMDSVIPQQEGLPMLALMGLGSNDPGVLRSLTRFARTLIFCYDGDEAGYNRAFSICVNGLFGFIDENPKVIVRMAFLPDGYDPDEFVIKFGKDKLLEILTKGQTAEEFVVSKIISDGLKIESLAERRAWLFENHEKSIANLPKLMRSTLLKRISESLELDIVPYFEALPSFKNKSYPEHTTSHVHTTVQKSKNNVSQTVHDNEPQYAESADERKKRAEHRRMLQTLHKNYPALFTIKSNHELLEIANNFILQVGLTPLTYIDVPNDFSIVSNIPANTYWKNRDHRAGFLREYNTLVAKHYFEKGNLTEAETLQIQQKMVQLNEIVMKKYNG